MSRTGLVAVQRQVRRDGKTFTQTVWIKPHHESKVDHKKVIETPDWKFKSADDVKSEVARINDISDRSERLVLKEQLLAHIEKDMGVSWDKIPPTEKNAFGRNCLRAFSAAKKHLTSNPSKQPAVAPKTPPQPAAPTPTPTGSGNGLTVSKQPGTSYIMDRPKSKDLAKEFRDKHGMDKTLDAMKNNGIAWDEVPDKGPNNMRALRALASFIRHGGELTEGAAKTPSPKAAEPKKAEPKKAEPKSKYKPGTIMHDFENAPKEHKAIALATGILPTDENSAKYLMEHISSGAMGKIERDLADIDFGLDSLEKSRISQAVDFFENRMNTPHMFLGRIEKYGIEKLKGFFKGTDYEAEMEELAGFLEEFPSQKNAKSPGSLIVNGLGAVDSEVKAAKVILQVDKDFLDSTGEEFILKLADEIDEAIRFDDGDFIDSLELHKLIFADKDDDNQVVSKIFGIASNKKFVQDITLDIGGDLLGAIRGEYFDKYGKSIAPGMPESDFEDFKFEAAAKLADLIHYHVKESNKLTPLKERKGAIGNEKIRDKYVEKNRTPFPNLGLKISADPKKKIDIPVLKARAEELTAVSEKYNSEEKAPFLNAVEYMLGFSAGRDTFESAGCPTKDDFKKKRTGLDYNLMRAVVSKEPTKKARAEKEKAFLAEMGETALGYDPGAIHDLLKAGKVDESLFPSLDIAEKNVKSSLLEVTGTERSVVEKKVQSTHDKRNHGGFTTKVRGVYRIKNIASEEKFQEINDKINTTGFYYHGTSVGTSQKILGESGGFKVFDDDSQNKIKAGSMLGYGIYLASESSKSAQYAGDTYGRGTTRGTLFLCKASLGNVEQTRSRGFDVNQPLMKKDSTDTVFMDSPDVLNPEWAVKRAEQAIPRLLIDIDRISN